MSIRLYRPEQLSVVKRALAAIGNEWGMLPEQVRHLVDQMGYVRHLRRRHREVGSTLRVKGLEYDHVILLDPDQMPSAEHLYVALSRARKRITLAVSPGKGLGPWFTKDGRV